MTFLTPFLVLADAGGADQGPPEDPRCFSFVCECYLDGIFNGNEPNAHTTTTCQTTCADTAASQAAARASVGYSGQEISTSKLQCYSENGVKINIDAPSVVNTTPIKDPILPCLNVPIPGLGFGNCDPDGKQKSDVSQFIKFDANGNQINNLLGYYVGAMYKFLLIAGAIVAVTMLMIAGVQYATARGESKQVDQAKKRINNAVVGIILLLLAYNIAFVLDPGTVKFDALTIKLVPEGADPMRSAFNSQEADGSIINQYKNISKTTPEELEKGVKFFATSYYAPLYNETGYKGISFECNIAMQCACPSGRAETKSCYSEGLNYYWAPCNSFSSDVPFCDYTTARRQGITKTPPQAFHTAAIDISTMPFGTVFVIFGAPDSQANYPTVWYAEDTGAEIKGRRVDLFLGSGQGAYARALLNSGEITLRTCPNNDPNKCPTSAN